MTKHTLSDGTTLGIRVVGLIVGEEYLEVPSRKRKAGSLMRIDKSMYLMAAKNLVPIRHPDYSYAESRKAARELALRFFVQSAEGCIEEAAKEGIPVEQCYGAAE
ncbi:hypothetical protein [Streptomyces sp. H27-H5]|uniref:hypothetical protein n=1 Tax=Streptomyces sp. H27-H5 TaxID=2996460 RepID=UPI00226DA6EF|nr:hypothetical protein [Streptomyces sp. H27-H5]MCY0955823.1 hypothetical protein [Streptomyces sp. H27-H5]